METSPAMRICQNSWMVLVVFSFLNSDLLAKELKTLYNINIAFRYTNVTLGPGKEEISSAPTKALHIVTPTKNMISANRLCTKFSTDSLPNFRYI